MRPIPIPEAAVWPGAKRIVAEQCGIPASGLTRLRQGKHLSADALAALVAWLYPARLPNWIKEG